MEGTDFRRLLEDTPIIMAVKSDRQLADSLKEDGRIVCVLYGDIMTISGIVDRIKDAGKLAMIHIDLLDGLTAKDIAVDFIIKNTRADGILSTKPSLIRKAKAEGLLTVQRFFILDSLSLNNVEKQFPLQHADAIEVLPGAMPKVIAQLTKRTNIPLIAGGLIADKEDVVNSLGAGAVSVSSSNAAIWNL